LFCVCWRCASRLGGARTAKVVRGCAAAVSASNGSCAKNGLQGAFLRKGWKGGSTKQNPRHTAAPDLVDRDFTATAPNRLWVADLTRILTGEGVLWLASVQIVRPG
jgi:transposase InsO family protein